VLDGTLVCAGCRKAMALDLIELPGLDERLVEAHAAAGGRNEISTGGHAGLDLRDQPANARAEIRTMLSTWCRAVAEDRGFALPDDTVPAMAGSLLGRRGAMLDWICEQTWVGDFHAGIDAVHWDAFRVAHPGGDRRRPVAPCGLSLWCDVATRAVYRCPGTLVVTLPGDGLDHLSDATCDECGREVPPVRWLRLVDKDVRLTDSELSGLWGVPARTIRRWAQADRWVSDGGRPARYSVVDAERTLRRLRPDGHTEGVPA
jgi:hypothetical protein